MKVVFFLFFFLSFFCFCFCLLLLLLLLLLCFMLLIQYILAPRSPQKILHFIVYTFGIGSHKKVSSCTLVIMFIIVNVSLTRIIQQHLNAQDILSYLFVLFNDTTMAYGFISHQTRESERERERETERERERERERGGGGGRAKNVQRQVFTPPHSPLSPPHSPVCVCVCVCVRACARA